MGNGFTKLIQDTESLFIAEKEFKCNTENKESSLCCEQIIATLVGVKLKARENQFAKGWKIILTENGPNTIESNEFVSSLNFLKPIHFQNDVEENNIIDIAIDPNNIHNHVNQLFTKKFKVNLSHYSAFIIAHVQYAQTTHTNRIVSDIKQLWIICLYLHKLNQIIYINGINCRGESKRNIRISNNLD
eukprot:79661_1